MRTSSSLPPSRAAGSGGWDAGEKRAVRCAWRAVWRCEVRLLQGAQVAARVPAQAHLGGLAVMVSLGKVDLHDAFALARKLGVRIPIVV
jgi:hypothetical protein